MKKMRLSKKIILMCVIFTLGYLTGGFIKSLLAPSVPPFDRNLRCNFADLEANSARQSYEKFDEHYQKIYLRVLP